jgi:mRNA interferase MazF
MAWLDPIVGREQGGRRPVLVVSSNNFNALPHSLCVAVPLTRTNRHLPLHVEIASGQAGLTANSVIMCDQVRSISIDRLQKRVGVVDDGTISQVMTILHRILPQTDVPLD